MATDEFEAFLRSPSVKQYLGDLSADTETALAQTKRILASSAMKHCTPRALSAYRKDDSVVKAAFADFNHEWQNVIAGKAKSLKPFEEVHHALVDGLELLEHSNTEFKAVVDADLGVKLMVFSIAMKDLMGQGAKMGDMEWRLRQLLKSLQQASGKVMGASAKMGINAAISLGLMAVGPMGWAAKIGIMIGTEVIGMAVDAAAKSDGPPTPIKDAYTVTATAVDASGKLKGNADKMFGAFTKIIDMGLDVKETADAVRAKQKLDAELKAFMKDYKVVLANYDKMVKDLKAAMQTAQRSFLDAVANANKFTSKKSKRMGMKKEFH